MAQVFLFPRFDFAANPGTTISPDWYLNKNKTKNNNELSLEVGSSPASLGSRSLGCFPSSRDHTPSVPKAGRCDRQGAEQRQWHPLARQGRQVLGRRHPGPSPKHPVKLEAISEPQVPRGPRGTQDRPPYHRRAAEWRAGRHRRQK